MWEYAPVDQADEYGRNLLSRNRLSEVEKFNLLREVSLCIAGNRADGRPRTSREEYENLILGFYQERITLDLHIFRDGTIGVLLLLSSKCRRERDSLSHFQKREECIVHYYIFRGIIVNNFLDGFQKEYLEVLFLRYTSVPQELA
jgi:hypothetical protein